MFSIRDMQFHPSDVDIKRYLTPPDSRERERQILKDVSIFNRRHHKNLYVEKSQSISDIQEMLHNLEEHVNKDRRNDFKMLERIFVLGVMIFTICITITLGALVLLSGKNLISRQ
jgi:hypothetical protein